MLRSLVKRDSGNLLGIQHLPDDREPLRKALLDSTAEVVIVTGGNIDDDLHSRAVNDPTTFPP